MDNDNVDFTNMYVDTVAVAKVDNNIDIDNDNNTKDFTNNMEGFVNASFFCTPLPKIY